MTDQITSVRITVESLEQQLAEARQARAEAVEAIERLSALQTDDEYAAFWQAAKDAELTTYQAVTEYARAEIERKNAQARAELQEYAAATLAKVRKSRANGPQDYSSHPLHESNIPAAACTRCSTPTTGNRSTAAPCP